jgi:hypothetical protein
MAISKAKANAASKAAATAKAAKDAAAAAKTKLASVSGGGGTAGNNVGQSNVGQGPSSMTTANFNAVLNTLHNVVNAVNGSITSVGGVSGTTTAPGSTAPNGQFVGTMPLAS